MNVVDSRNVSWIIVFTVAGTFDLDVNVTGKYNGVGDVLKYRSVDITVFPRGTPSKTVVGQGYSLNVNITVANQGNYTETFNVTAYANTTSIASQNVTLGSGNCTTITFTWNTTGFAYGDYTMSAYASPATGETGTTNNTYTDGIVTVTIPGDTYGNFKVDLGDIVALCEAFGSTRGQDGYYWHIPPCILCKHTPNCDINDNGQIGMDDMVIACEHFGQQYP